MDTPRWSPKCTALTYQLLTFRQGQYETAPLRGQAVPCAWTPRSLLLASRQRCQSWGMDRGGWWARLG